MKDHTALIITGSVAILALIIFALLAYQASASRKLGGESGQCYYLDQCRYENEGFGKFTGYNYHACTGAWSAYGKGWVRDERCDYPDLKP